jgi:hypothetical protein
MRNAQSDNEDWFNVEAQGYWILQFWSNHTCIMDGFSAANVMWREGLTLFVFRFLLTWNGKLDTNHTIHGCQLSPAIKWFVKSLNCLSIEDEMLT